MRRHPAGGGFVRVTERTAELIAGEIDPAEWDDEELLRGYSRAKDGSFRGRPPSVVPMEVYQEFVRRQLHRAEQGFVDSVADAVRALRNIALDPEVEPPTRLKAIEMILDRVWGKPTQRHELGGALTLEPWRQVVEDVTIDRDLDVLDAEIVDEEEYVFP